MDLFVETTVIAGTKVRLELWNVLDDTEQRDRRFFSPDRNGMLEPARNRAVPSRDVVDADRHR